MHSNGLEPLTFGAVGQHTALNWSITAGRKRLLCRGLQFRKHCAFGGSCIRSLLDSVPGTIDSVPHSVPCRTPPTARCGHAAFGNSDSDGDRKTAPDRRGQKRPNPELIQATECGIMAMSPFGNGFDVRCFSFSAPVGAHDSRLPAVRFCRPARRRLDATGFFRLTRWGSVIHD